MAAETRERSTSSVLNFAAITAEEITNAAECVLWLLKGTGSDRDKKQQHIKINKVDAKRQIRRSP